MTPSPLSLPHHDPSARYVDEPNPSLGDTVTISLEPGAIEHTAVWLRTVLDGEQVWVAGAPDGARIRFPVECTQDVVNYRFYLETTAGPRWLNGHGLIDFDPTDAADFRLITTGQAPSWVNEKVWYQIFCDRFATTGHHRHEIDWGWWAEWDEPVARGPAAMTQLYGGDLDGVIAHLDHLASLGIGGIYLTPVFPAGSNHRYDATTFDHVDPLLGGDDALARLSAAASDRGIRVMTDLTLNHTGRAHDWFRAARADASSVEASFYHFTDHPNEYVSWLDVATLPKLDHRSRELRRRLYDGADSALARYLGPPFDMAGWRIDVANMTGRLGTLDLNQEVARVARATVDSIDPDRWIVAEHFFDASADCRGDGWHGTMNYAGVIRPIASWLGQFAALSTFMTGPGQPPRDGLQMARSMDAVRAAMPWAVTTASMTLLGSHDNARWRTMATSDDVALVGFGLLLSLPGVPTFLYGDEVGLTGATPEAARKPMPWDHSRWERRFLGWYRDLIAVRNREPALRTGGFRWVHLESDAVVFLRETATDRLLVRAARASTEPMRIECALLLGERLEPLVNADPITAVNGVLTLDGDGPAYSLWRVSDS